MGRPETTYSEIRSWTDRRRGTITQSVRGSYVDITVRLGMLASRSWSTLVVIAGIIALAFAGQALQSFIAGHAQQVLANVLKAAN